MKRVEVGVKKVETWEEANWSMRLRYLIPSSAILPWIEPIVKKRRVTSDCWSIAARPRNPSCYVR